MKLPSVLVVACVLMWPAVSSAQTTGPCRVSSDPEFGLTPEKAIPTGGNVFLGAGRQRRYLNLLRGPSGQPVTLASGVGSGPAGDAKTIIDRYSVSYEGAEKSVTLYLNMYAFGTPQVPQGFTCVESPSAALGPPPAEPVTIASTIVAHAVAELTTRPIVTTALGDLMGTTRAIAVDFFNTVGARARAAAASGQPVAPFSPSTTIIAYPMKCGEMPVPATGIEIIGPQGQQLARFGQIGPPDIPGVPAPDGSIAARFALPSLPSGTVQITYAKPNACPDLPQQLVLSLRPEPARIVTSDQPPLPAGVTDPDPSVFVVALLDVDGSFKQVAYMAGPQSLTAAAIEAVGKWKGAPARMNGEPMVTVVSLRVAFK